MRGRCCTAPPGADSRRSRCRAAINTGACPRKYSPDNARCEGFFGRLKREFFHGCGWAGIAIEEFIDTLDACLRWHSDARIKGDLDYRSPMQYRRDLGLPAA